MYDTVGFYNHFGAGDIFESREFVRYIMSILPAGEYIYYSGKSKRLLLDMDIVASNNVPNYLDARKPFMKVGNSLYINTWIGRDSRYVLPGIGCTVEKLFEMYNDILSKANGSRLEGTPLDYLTTVDYTKFDTKGIDLFLNTVRKSKKVFVSNGNVQSMQADNFDMLPVIEALAREHSNVIFFVTSPINTELDNIIDANLLVDKSLDSNLMELSYLSTFCNGIIGRNSGPQVFSWTRENCFSDKVNITLSYRAEGQHFVYNTPIMMKKYWSNSTDTYTLLQFINYALYFYL